MGANPVRFITGPRGLLIHGRVCVRENPPPAIHSTVLHRSGLVTRLRFSWRSNTIPINVRRQGISRNAIAFGSARVNEPDAIAFRLIALR